MRRARHRPATLAAAAVAVVLVALAALGAGARPADAHAVLLSSSPGEGERLPQPPSEVTLTFSEDISAGLGGLQVLDATGGRVDVGTATQPNPAQLRVDLRPDLGTGTYLATYRIISADGHPVNGTIVFAVGDVLDAGSVAGAAGDDTTGEAVGMVGRVLTYLGTLLAAGLAGFLAFVHDGGSERRRLVAIARTAGLVAIAGTVLVVAAQAALATGRGLGVVTDGEVLSAVLGEAGLGWSVAVLFVGLALLYVALGTSNVQVRQGVTLYGGLVACGSFLLWGHSTGVEERLLAGAADLVHVSVAAVWLGGLVGLALTLRSRATAPDADRASALDGAGVVLRFSTAAAYSVVALWISGALMAWTMGEDLPGSLTETDWGRRLLLKAGLVVVVLLIAAWNRRRLVPAILDAADAADAEVAAAAPATDPPAAEVGATSSGAPGAADAPSGPAVAVAAAPTTEQAVRDEPAWRLLGRTTLAELAILALVVVVTAWLVNTPPGAGSGAGVFDATLPVDDRLQVQVLVSPADTTPNSIHVTYLDDLGRPADAALAVTVRATLDDPPVGPVEVELRKAGPGHFLATTDALALPGTWDVEIVTRIDEFTAERTAVQVPISSP